MPIVSFLIALQYGRFFLRNKKAASATTLTADKSLITWLLHKVKFEMVLLSVKRIVLRNKKAPAK